jgi:peptidoglycan hydrolase-like protein with peptidoglycan-binding domain/methionine-rich copper-binding protein CopC
MSNVGSYSSGLVAILNNSTIEDSFVAGDVSSSDANYIGGIAGYIINDALIRRVYMSGEVTSPGARIGGLVGLMNGTGATATSVIRDSFVVGAVSGHSTLSAALVGLIGAEISWVDDSVLINNYYDATRTGKTVCAIADTNLTDEAGVCAAVNTVASPDTGYFDDTTINDPLDQWNFSSVWVKDAGYPVLYETVNPLLTSVSPADNATSVAVDADLVLTFTEPVEAEAGSVLIKRASDDGTAAAFDVATDSSGSGSRTITLVSKGDLEFATDYYVEIQATAFDDVSGNSYVGIADSTTWNFTTRTASPPTVTAYTPAHGATGVAADSSFTLTFNEAVEVGTGSLYLRKVSYGVLVETIDVASSQISGSGTTAITITPSASLEPGVAYYFEVDSTAFDSVAGADFAGFTDSMTWSFTTDASSATGAAWWPGSAPLLPGSQNAPETSLVSQPAQVVAPSRESGALCLEDANDLLRRGDEGSMVALLQTALVILGDLDIAGLTGQFGPLTQSAVLSFQAREGLAQDGVVGPLTFGVLNTRLGCTGSASATQPRVLGATHTQAPEEYPEMAILRYGATGQSVAHLQNVLGKALGRELQADGVFGVATESAVREWQKRWGLVVDGIVGQATWDALNMATRR